jgi:hypothetical protein
LGFELDGGVEKNMEVTRKRLSKERIYGRGIKLEKYPPQKWEAESWYVFFYRLLDCVKVRRSIHALPLYSTG